MWFAKILRRTWLFSANMIKNSESGSNQPTQLIIAAHNCHKRLHLTLVNHIWMSKKSALSFTSLISDASPWSSKVLEKWETPEIDNKSNHVLIKKCKTNTRKRVKTKWIRSQIHPTIFQNIYVRKVMISQVYESSVQRALISERHVVSGG